MVHTFATREEAAIFASAMRAEGYYAGILDEGMGAIYGPLAIGGIRVIVSDESAENEGDESSAVQTLPPTESNDGELLTTVRLLVVGVAACGLVILAIALLAAFSNQPGGLLRELGHLLKYPLVIGLAFAAMGPAMAGFTRWLRGEEVSEGSALLRWLLLALLIPFLILVAW